MTLYDLLYEDKKSLSYLEKQVLNTIERFEFTKSYDHIQFRLWNKDEAEFVKSIMRKFPEISFSIKRIC